MRSMLYGILFVAFAIAQAACSSERAGTVPPEDCTNKIDDDGDGAVDCTDTGCAGNAVCQGQTELCMDGLDNDLDGQVDCVDPDCAASGVCTEDCANGIDDNGDSLVDCADPECKGIAASCGEVCGDGMDNDADSAIDCADSDCFGVIPPCGGGTGSDGSLCAYNGEVPHPCACADGVDNDQDGETDGADLQCFGPFDDDEGSYATGIPGDNKGSKGNVECPFDGNSGPGNDAICCDLLNPSQNVTPNGCDNHGCCEIDVNGNLTGEHVYVSGTCSFAPACGQSGKLGCGCALPADCDLGQFCVPDDDSGAGFCATCEPCAPNAECENTCACGEVCFGGFVQPAAECGGGGGGAGGDCPTGVTACPTGTECNSGANEQCTNGCCFATCAPGVTPCQVSADCPTDVPYYCITGCCVEVPA